MSAPIYELLKRPDELFVVEHAHLQPRFVEDSVRLSLKGALEAMPELADDDFVFARQVNFETIHAHDVLAEREGTVGELRGRARSAHAAAGRHTSLADWLAGLGRRGLRPAAEAEAALRAGAEAGDVGLVQDEHARRRRSPRRRSPATARRARAPTNGQRDAR